MVHKKKKKKTLAFKFSLPNMPIGSQHRETFLLLYNDSSSKVNHSRSTKHFLVKKIPKAENKGD